MRPNQKIGQYAFTPTTRLTIEPKGGRGGKSGRPRKVLPPKLLLRQKPLDFVNVSIADGKLGIDDRIDQNRTALEGQKSLLSRPTMPLRRWYGEVDKHIGV